MLIRFIVRNASSRIDFTFDGNDRPWLLLLLQEVPQVSELIQTIRHKKPPNFDELGGLIENPTE